MGRPGESQARRRVDHFHLSAAPPHHAPAFEPGRRWPQLLLQQERDRAPSGLARATTHVTRSQLGLPEPISGRGLLRALTSSPSDESEAWFLQPRTRRKPPSGPVTWATYYSQTLGTIFGDWMGMTTTTWTTWLDFPSFGHGQGPPLYRDTDRVSLVTRNSRLRLELTVLSQG